jgi:iron complex transport system substrate-binding protein
MSGECLHIRRRTLLTSLLTLTALPPRSAFSANTPRIVSLDYGLASTLLSLGIVPVGVSDLADWGKWVVSPSMPPGVVDLGSSMEVNMEVLVDLKPDLILTTPYLDALTAKLQPLARLSRYEVFTPDAGSILDAAIRATRKLGADIGRQVEAEEFLARADGYFEGCKARLAKLSPPPVALVNFMDERHARIYASPGLFDNVLNRIGVRNAWTEPSNYWGFQLIAIEELSRATDPDAVLIAFDPIPGDVLPKLHRSPLWQSLQFSRPGHFATLPPALMFGMVNEAMRFAGLLTDYLEHRRA